MSAAVHHLFVYGTLRGDSGHEMHRVLAEGASFVGPGSVGGRLYHMGWHPAAVPSSEVRHRVRGELYRMIDPELLDVMDDYEGCSPRHPKPHSFERVMTDVLLDDGRVATSWIYWYRGALERARLIDSGDWMRPS